MAKANLLAIDDWVKGLTEIPAQEFELERVEKYVRENCIRAETLGPYLFYATTHYTRNLIYKSEVFEVLSICWDIGQVSRIHNHREQNCWMATPIGRLRVQNFKVLERDPASGTCHIEESDAYTMDEANPGVVRPAQPVHQVLNLAEFGERATSIHVYSRPYSVCEVYLSGRARYSDVPLHYSSEYGKLLREEKLT
jgi:cysteine dioxygenase